MPQGANPHPSHPTTTTTFTLHIRPSIHGPTPMHSPPMMPPPSSEVVAGQARPLLRPPKLCPEIHGDSGLDGPSGGRLLPRSTRLPLQGGAKAAVVMGERIKEAWKEGAGAGREGEEEECGGAGGGRQPVRWVPVHRARGRASVWAVVGCTRKQGRRVQEPEEECYQIVQATSGWVVGAARKTEPDDRSREEAAWVGARIESSNSAVVPCGELQSVRNIR